jgi:putative hemolysin
MTVSLHRPAVPVFIRAGSLDIRLAESSVEIEAAQELRYQIFYEEMSAAPTPGMRALGRDFDSFDPYCDHLVIIDNSKGEGAKGIVATYRLMRREGARQRGQFYSIDEYDIGAIERFPGEILELGRSCVAGAYRTRALMQLLWKGIAEYVKFFRIGVMFGCGSFPGTDPQLHRLPLSYLHHRHLAPEPYRARALQHRYIDMAMMPATEINEKRAIQQLPPLIKGYLRLGGFVGDGAVIDNQFGTVDVNIVVVTDLMAGKYSRHYMHGREIANVSKPVSALNGE